MKLKDRPNSAHPRRPPAARPDWIRLAGATAPWAGVQARVVWASAFLYLCLASHLAGAVAAAAAAAMAIALIVSLSPLAWASVDLAMKLVNNVMQAVSEAKAAEDEARQLVAPAEMKALTGPRAEASPSTRPRESQVAREDFSADLDDEIPF